MDVPRSARPPRDKRKNFAGIICAKLVHFSGVMQGNGRETGGGGIRHKLGSFFSPRGPPPPARGREEGDHSTFITADVLRVRGRGLREGGDRE